MSNLKIFPGCFHIMKDVVDIPISNITERIRVYVVEIPSSSLPNGAEGYEISSSLHFAGIKQQVNGSFLSIKKNKNAAWLSKNIYRIKVMTDDGQSCYSSAFMVVSHWRKEHLKTLMKHVYIPEETLEWWEMIEEFKTPLDARRKAITSGFINTWAKETTATIGDLLRSYRGNDLATRLIKDIIDRKKERDSKMKISINSLCN